MQGQPLSPPPSRPATAPRKPHLTPPPAPLQACNRMSYECVPLYDSLGENAIEFILRHSEAAAVFVAGGKAPKLAAALGELKVRFLGGVGWGPMRPGRGGGCGGVCGAAGCRPCRRSGHTARGLAQGWETAARFRTAKVEAAVCFAQQPSARKSTNRKSTNHRPPPAPPSRAAPQAKGDGRVQSVIYWGDAPDGALLEVRRGALGRPGRLWGRTEAARRGRPAERSGARRVAPRSGPKTQKPSCTFGELFPPRPSHQTPHLPRSRRPAPPPAPQKLRGQGLEVLSWEEASEAGARKPTEAVPPGADDYCTIMYTSGTTGGSHLGPRLGFWGVGMGFGG
jgi:acyl-CoA synthetase (AMP-forming)/AMP-acid ligase II